MWHAEAMSRPPSSRANPPNVDRIPLIALWVARVSWGVAPLAVGPMIAAVNDRGLRSPLEVLGWVLWACGLAALFVPRPAGLTTMRLIVLGMGWGLGALALSGQPISFLALGAWIALACVTLNRPLADALVDGKSYGSERRFALRLPPAIALVALPTVAMAWSGAIIGGFVMFNHAFASGAALLCVCTFVAFITLRSTSTMSNRFLVFVPAGCVVADPFVLLDPVLMPGSHLVSIGAAEDPIAPLSEDARSRDLRLGAALASIRVRFTEPGRIAAKERFGGVQDVNEILVTPARTVAFMKSARARRLLSARA